MRRRITALDDDHRVLLAAQQGDRDAFDRLMRPELDRLLAHCYRMLGSIHDADDAVQDTLLRAWRALARFDGDSAIGTWLYRIATNVSLDLIDQRSRRYLPVDLSSDDPAWETHRWIEPFAHPLAEDPLAAIERLETVEIAFVAALQHLPARQRAVLLLRDVLGFSAADTADTLEMTVAAANSSLQRARRSLAHRPLPGSDRRDRGHTDDHNVLARRYVDAWERADAAAIVAMLTDDATFSMPPYRSWYRGRDAIATFLADEPMRVPWRLQPTRAGANLAFACYTLDDGRWTAHSLDVVIADEERIHHIVGFIDARLVTRLGHPRTLPSLPARA